MKSKEELLHPLRLQQFHLLQPFEFAKLEVAVDIRDLLARLCDILESIGVTVYVEKADNGEVESLECQT